MLNFPYPYEDELTYSILARASAHFCSFSHKTWLEQTLKNRCAIATLDFPSHLDELSKLFFLDKISSEDLIYQHTLFPLFAPFITQERKDKCFDWMKGKSNGGTHLMTGWAAGRLPQPQSIRYCPICISEQTNSLGEAYWQRIHQVTGLVTCNKHNCMLEDVSNFNHKRHRHEYYRASTVNQTQKPRLSCNEFDKRLTPFIQTLLNSSERSSPKYQQWTRYYHDLIHQSHCEKGQYCCFEAVMEKVLGYWSEAWLQQYNLWPIDTNCSWLHGITRKHRNSFSYLEHIVVLHALHEGQWDINDVLCEVAEIKEPKALVQKPPSQKTSQAVIRKAKCKWLKVVKKLGTKIARTSKAGGLYMWLYRNQHNWLIRLNKRYQRPIDNSTNRVNWRQRDVSSTKLLIKIRNQTESDLTLPRHSKLWFLQQLPNKATIEKNLSKLPVTSSFLNAYQETVTEYQIRRLARAMIYESNLPSWQLIRSAGLSEERMTDVTRKFCKSHGLI
jgi:hypothetical protein